MIALASGELDELIARGEANEDASGRYRYAPGDDKDSDVISNQLEDLDLSGTYYAGDLYDWQVYNTPTPGRPAAIINDFEDWDCQRNAGIVGNHAAD